jgi:hypothetical protein
VSGSGCQRHVAMRPTMLLAAVAWALLSLAAVRAAICPSSPYTMDGTKTSADLNAVLASWSDQACNGTITFTASTPTTYQLANVTYMPSNAHWTLDGSGSGGVTIAAYNTRVIDTWGSGDFGGGYYVRINSSLTVKGLTFKGNGKNAFTVEGYYDDGGCFSLYGPSLYATDCTFEDFGAGEDGGAMMLCCGGYVYKWKSPTA